MKYKVDGWNNFCRIFELPETYPKEYCFGGGHPVSFQMVDWFNPVPGIAQPAVTKKFGAKKSVPLKLWKSRMMNYEAFLYHGSWESNI